MKDDELLIRKDRMRYTKNKLSASLVYLAILFDVFFFVSVYKSDVSTYYYTILIGASIIYNLVFLLLSFLSSEGVKEYSEKYCYLLFILAFIQIIRIFILPIKAHSAVVKISGVERVVMANGQFARCIIYLFISSISLFASAIVGIIRSRTLKSYLATLGEEVRRD